MLVYGSCSRSTSRSTLETMTVSLCSQCGAPNSQAQPHTECINPIPTSRELLGCPDGGVCHHSCSDSCSRVASCGPLSGVYPNDQWPPNLDSHSPGTIMFLSPGLPVRYRAACSCGWEELRFNGKEEAIGIAIAHASAHLAVSGDLVRETCAELLAIQKELNDE
jgi:hypothetical protein